jgi:hypothetical protein
MVLGLGFRVWGLGFRIQGIGLIPFQLFSFKLCSLQGFSLGFRVQGFRANVRLAF